jgi:hypothetical protein
MSQDIWKQEDTRVAYTEHDGLIGNALEVLGSNLDRSTDYPDLYFHCTSVSPGKFRESISIQATTVTFHILSCSFFTVIQSFDIMHSELLRDFLNNLQIEHKLTRRES